MISDLQEKMSLINTIPHGAGWLQRMRFGGVPGIRCDNFTLEGIDTSARSSAPEGGSLERARKGLSLYGWPGSRSIRSGRRSGRIPASSG
jgi:hypothetical protein